MQKNEKSKKDRLEKLRMILDAPSNRNLHPEDEKHLDSLRRRLVGQSKKSTEYIYRTTKEDEGERIDPLRPEVKIYHKEEKKKVIAPEIKRLEPEKKREEQKESLYEDKELYEVEKFEVEGPEFLEVKPKEITKKMEKVSTVEIEENSKVSDNEITDTADDKKDVEDEKLPEWEPLETKNHEFTEVEEIKEEIKSEPVEALPPPPENDVFLPVEKKELEEIEGEKKEPKEAKELKKKEEERIKKMELRKAKMEEREKERKLGKEAKIEEKKSRLEAKNSLKEANREKKLNAQLNTELEEKQQEIETINGQLNTKEELIRQLQTELEDRNNNLESTNNELNKKEEEITRLQTDLEQNMEEAKEFKRKERERSEKEKEEDKIKKMELKKAKMEEREKERKIRKEAKIEEKKSRLEAKNSIRERTELENKISEEKSIEEIPGVDRDSKINIFREIKSIDEETAVLLYDGGFTSIDAVSKASLKDLIRIGKIEKKLAKNAKREIEQKLEESSTKTEEEPGEYFILDEGFDEGEAKKIDRSIAEHKFIDEEKDFFEEGEEGKAIKKDKEIDAFKGINNIDEKTASLLYENGITSIDILRGKSVRELTRIKGIRRKLAKRIKKEIESMDKKTEQATEQAEDFDHKLVHDTKDDAFIEDKADEEEWESHGIDEKQKEGYTYKDYTLYKKKIETKSGKKRLVRFFSKKEPNEGEPSELPTGFEVKVNKKTGLPYLKKKK